MVFSDEKKFRFRPGGVVKVWRRRGDRFKAKYTVPTVGQSDGVMVWAAMNSYGQVIVRQCPPKMNSTAYQAVLATALPFIKPRCASHLSHFVRAGRHLFQQDGAPVHTSASTTAWLARKQVRLLNNGVWPAQSPDLNPIEQLWPTVTKQLEGRTFSSAASLWAALQQEFAAIPAATVQNLYNSMARRVAAVIVSSGGHTKY